MTRCQLLSAVSASLLMSICGAAAAPPVGLTVGPPASVTMGPPASVTMGPPASVTAGPPATITMGTPAGALLHSPTGAMVGQPPGAAPSVANAASELGKLNAVHASSVALGHAAPNSTVGAVATYQDEMAAALALTDPAAQASAITAAREDLATATGRQLTASSVTHIDVQLGITGASPTLGTTQ